MMVPESKRVSCFKILFMIPTAVLLILILSSSVYSGQTEVRVTVNKKESLEISDFIINPASAGKNQIIEFGFRIRNTGNTEINITPEIQIYQGSRLVDKISFGVVSINAGGDISLSTSWNTADNPDGVYSALVKVSYDNTSVNQIGEFYIKSSSPVVRRGGGGGGGGIVFMPYALGEEEISEPGEEYIEFTEVPVLIELKKGESSLFYIEVKNRKDSMLKDVNVDLKGIPDELIRFQKTVNLEPESSLRIDFTVNTENLIPGDYRTKVQIGKGCKTSFIIRIKDYPDDWNFPVVKRNVVLRNGDEIRVVLEVENNGMNTEEFEVIETIPKTLASSINKIRFDREPEIIEADPVVKWILGKVSNSEKIHLSYTILNETDDLSSAIYWPVKQILKHKEILKPEPTVVKGDKDIDEFIPSLYTAIILLDTLIIIGSIFVFAQLRNYLRRR